MASLGRPHTVAAKEAAAACEQILSLVGRMHNGGLVAAIQRARGSSLAAYQTLRVTAASILKDSDSPSCGALGPTLAGHVRRAAAASTALDASVEIERGFEASLSLLATGRPPSTATTTKLAPVREATLYAERCPDLFALTIRLEGPSDAATTTGASAATAGIARRVDDVLSDLRARPRCPRVRRVLESTPRAQLARAVDAIRLDEPTEDPPAPPLAGRCPELAIIIERLSSAIERGAPVFNRGDHQGCHRQYEETARRLMTESIGAGHCPKARELLQAGITQAAAAAVPGEAAWALRRSFDAILEGYGTSTGP